MDLSLLFLVYLVVPKLTPSLPFRRTAVELGLATAGDRVITVDRTLGQPGDMHLHSFNMKMSTIKAA